MARLDHFQAIAPLRWMAVGLLGLLLLALTATSAEAKQPATTAQKNAMARAVPAAVRGFLPRAQPAFRTCFRLDRSAAFRSTKVRSFRFGFIRYQQGSGACAAEDASYSFYAYWKTSPNGLRFKGGVNQAICVADLKVPLAVQRELFPTCSVI